jgi:cell division protease FtsH
MVTIYGLNDKIGNVTYYDSTGQRIQFLKPYSEETAKVIDMDFNFNRKPISKSNCNLRGK